MIGQRFGSLIVMKAATRGRYWCKCDCGSKGRSSLTVPRKKLLRGEIAHCTGSIHGVASAKSTNNL